MAHVVSGANSSSQYDNGSKFKQLVTDYIAHCPELAQEYLEIEGRSVNPEAISYTAALFLPQYIEQVGRFLREASPSVSHTDRDEALSGAITHLLMGEHLGLAAKILSHPDLGVSRRVRENIRPLAEYEILSALKTGRSEGILELGTALDPLFFHSDIYCAALTEKITGLIDHRELAKVVELIDAPIQIPDRVIYETRSAIEEAILHHVADRRPLSEVYGLSDMFMLSDFFKEKPYLDVLRRSIDGALKERDFNGACTIANESVGFERIRRSLMPSAEAGALSARAEYEYFLSDDRTRHNERFLETLNLTIWQTVETFGLKKQILNGLPVPSELQRYYRVGQPPCRLAYPTSRRRDDE